MPKDKAVRYPASHLRGGSAKYSAFSMHADAVAAVNSGGAGT